MWQIARKEILLNLLSLRFALGTAVAVCMMGIVGHVLVEDFAPRQQAYIADVQRHEEALAETKVFSRLSVTVDFPPLPCPCSVAACRICPPVGATGSPAAKWTWVQRPSSGIRHPAAVRD